jgi:hypothetical protein
MRAREFKSERRKRKRNPLEISSRSTEKRIRRSSRLGRSSTGTDVPGSPSSGTLTPLRLAVGLCVSLAVNRLLADQLFGTKPRERAECSLEASFLM